MEVKSSRHVQRTRQECTRCVLETAVCFISYSDIHMHPIVFESRQFHLILLLMCSQNVGEFRGNVTQGS